MTKIMNKGTKNGTKKIVNDMNYKLNNDVVCLKTACVTGNYLSLNIFLSIPVCMILK